ncbi:MAG: hypothetical protein ICV53_20950, partial [Flavisolibacter sp.]|nr:hypothetical protein [Flavisolibacter sp.]
DNAATMIRTLSAAPYKAAVGTNGGFILQHCVGHMPQKTEVDVPLTYADYYFVEAMGRYKPLVRPQTSDVKRNTGGNAK